MSTKNKRDEGCCGIFFLKYVLFIFNAIFWFSGMAILGVGIWTLITKHKYVVLLTTGTFAATTYILIVTGAIVVLLGILGCFGALRENRCCLITYAFMLLLVFLLEAIAGILAYMYEGTLREELMRNLNSTMIDNYRFDLKKTQAIDDLQMKFKCCGAMSFRDWRYSKWLRTDKLTNNTAPDSCCKTYSVNCAVRDHPSNIFYDGCLVRLENFLREHLIILGAVGLGICCLQIFGIIFACCLARRIKDHDGYRQPANYYS